MLNDVTDNLENNLPHDEVGEEFDESIMIEFRQAGLACVLD